MTTATPTLFVHRCDGEALYVLAESIPDDVWELYAGSERLVALHVLYSLVNGPQELRPVPKAVVLLYPTYDLGSADGV